MLNVQVEPDALSGHSLQLSLQMYMKTTCRKNTKPPQALKDMQVPLNVNTVIIPSCSCSFGFNSLNASICFCITIGNL